MKTKISLDELKELAGYSIQNGTEKHSIKLLIEWGESAEAEIERLKAELAGETLPRESCKWSEDADGNWETDCGNAFCLEDGPPSENNLRYCCYCGRKLEEVLYEEPSGGEGG